MVDLVEWLTACLDAEEAEVRLTADAFGAVWTTDDAMESVRSDTGADVVTEPYTPRSFIAEHDPARVLREIAAKREIVEQHVPVGDGTVCLSYCHTRTPGEAQVWPCLTLQLLALPYSDRPGYRDEWKPIRLYRAGSPGVIDYEEAP